VYLVNVDGSGLRNLTREWGLDGTPVWSPDRRRFAFSNNRALYVMNADGAGKRRLTSGGVAPAWSPDGKKLVFTRPRRSLKNSELWIINADGSGRRKLAGRGNGAVWSPDGRRLAFTSHRDGNPEVYVMNADDTGQRRSQFPRSRLATKRPHLRPFREWPRVESNHRTQIRRSSS
jgi:Tol biopolymer transport system component